MTITTNADEMRGQLAPLYKRYPGQTDNQSAHIEIDPEKRTMTAAINYEIGNAVPEAVWNRRVLRVAVGAYHTGDAVAELLDKLAPVAALVCDGHSVEWDGSNQVGRLTDAAYDALRAIEHAAAYHRTYGEDRRVSVVEVGMWLGDYQMDPGMTDEQISAEAARLAQEAASEMVVLDEATDGSESAAVSVIEAYLRSQRDGGRA